MRNRILDSRSEGIFIIESGFSQIHANEICGNNDGIVMFDSSPQLLANDICENARSGVIIGGCSFPRIERNLIAHNITAGILLRDEALAKCINNKVRYNLDYNNISDIQQLLPGVSPMDEASQV